ncbi:unnamed protein product [Ceratitis capitata]|uniref:(Mediterranean fruit fly) hypothetical protein n=1 Tax=Ceratitis capitata TaxID=7213 RepID=A0A811V0T6_CERCA|nr:unnamed protein product [Ceratitis capitata]
MRMNQVSAALPENKSEYIYVLGCTNIHTCSHFQRRIPHPCVPTWLRGHMTVTVTVANSDADAAHFGCCLCRGAPLWPTDPPVVACVRAKNIKYTNRLPFALTFSVELSCVAVEQQLC